MRRALAVLFAAAATYAAVAAPAGAAPGLAFGEILKYYDETGWAIAVDGDGHAYVAGYTNSADFPTTPGAFDPSFNGAPDAFVTKLDRAGTAIVYSTFLGGYHYDIAEGVAVDRSGSAYVAGWTAGGFPTTRGAFDETKNPGREGFVAKLTPDGAALAYSTYLGGGGWDWGYEIAVDDSGSAYVTGTTTSTDFPTTRGAFQRTSGGDHDAFVTKLNPAGSRLAYSTYLGGIGIENQFEGRIAVDGGGSAFVTGETRSEDFPTTPGAFDETYNGGRMDVFVTKLNERGGALVYSTFLGGGGFDDGFGIAVDEAGSAFVTGWTAGNFPTTAGAFDRQCQWDAFVTKLDPAGSALVYSTCLGESGLEEGAGIAVDRAGNTHVTGQTTSSDFPTTRGAFDRKSNGEDAFVTKLNAHGTELVYSTYLGGRDEDAGKGIALDAAGSAYVTGQTYGPNFPTTRGAFDRTPGGETDAFATKLSASGSRLRYSTYLGGS